MPTPHCEDQLERPGDKHRSARRCQTRGIEAHIMEVRLRWAGHTARMDETRIPRMLLFGELEQGTRHVGRPLKRNKNQLKATLKRWQIQPENFESLALDRVTWRVLCNEAVDDFEHSRLEEFKAKRMRRKERIAVPGSFLRDRCPRVCSSAIGLRSHLKAHSRMHDRRCGLMFTAGLGSVDIDVQPIYI